MVRLEGHQTPEPRLQWHKIRRGEEEGGELLAACELFLVRLSCFIFLFNLYPAVEWVTLTQKLFTVHLGLLFPSQLPHLLLQCELKRFNKEDDVVSFTYCTCRMKVQNYPSLHP